MESTNSIRKNLRSKTKANKQTIIKKPIEKKRRSPSPARKTPINQLSKKELVKALSEMGIITPSSMTVDLLRGLYDANANPVLNNRAPGNVSTPHAIEKKRKQHEASQQFDDIDSDENEQSEGKSSHRETSHTVDSGKTFSLFSDPTAEEFASYGVVGLGGRGENDLEPVPKGLRKAIIEGYNVNLVRLLLPRDNKKYSRDDDEDPDRSIYLKPKSDPRLDRHLTILEFVLAFSRYINIMCEAFSHRRREFMAYMSDIIRLSARFGHPFFYDYHRLFAQKAEALLQTRNVLVDWSKRDHDTYFSVFSGLRPIVCELCRSPDHFTHFCKKVLDKSDALDRLSSNNSVRAADVSNAFSSSSRSVGGDKEKQDVRATCKYFNGAGFGRCVQLNCRFDHLCSRCRGNHPKKSCTQKQTNLQ